MPTPYGTTRRAVVVRTPYLITGMAKHDPPGQIIWDEEGDTHVLFGPHCTDHTISDGASGTLTFTAGGPLGDFWRFKADPRPAGDPAEPPKRLVASDPDDERIDVYVEATDRRIHIQFQKPMWWLAFDAPFARKLAGILRAKADELDKLK